jgi:hypothetical protein
MAGLGNYFKIIFYKYLFMESVLPVFVRVDTNQGFGRHKRLHKKRIKDRIDNQIIIDYLKKG